MEEYLFEIILGVALFALFVVFWYWQIGRKITADELNEYLSVLEEQLPQELEKRSEFLVRLRSWGENDDGRPAYMLNLMRFYNQLQKFPGGPDHGTPEEANAHYEAAAVPMVIKRGGYPVFVGRTMKVRAGGKPGSNLMVYNDQVEDWDRVLLTRYRCRRDFLDLVSNPEYLKVMPYKLASLTVALMPLKCQLLLPDLRWVVGLGCAIIFLLVGWVRAALLQ